jgi:uncharacterized membrane protein
MRTAQNCSTSRHRLHRVWLAFALLAALLLIATSPALAHKDHKKKQQEAAQIVEPGTQPPSQPGVPAAMSSNSAVHGQMGEMMDGMDMGMDRSKMTFLERLLDWFGRLHPMVVHFPIAFFPAALITAIAGRRRPSFATPVQFLVVAGGILAPFAAGAGWLAGMTADPEPILTYHRWLGVVIGVGGAGLGFWAWRRPWEDRGAGMILALTIMTIAIAVQGFLGAGLTHGMDHMMF